MIYPCGETISTRPLPVRSRTVRSRMVDGLWIDRGSSSCAREIEDREIIWVRLSTVRSRETKEIIYEIVLASRARGDRGHYITPCNVMREHLQFVRPTILSYSAGKLHLSWDHLLSYALIYSHLIRSHTLSSTISYYHLLSYALICSHCG